MTAPVATTIGLLLEPLDVLFFRDGRPFDGSERSVSGLPLPQTLAGTIRTALLRRAGCEFSRMRGAPTFPEAVRRACAPEFQWIAEVSVRGPWLARRCDEATPEVLVPTPAVLHGEKKRRTQALHRLTPLRPDRLPGWEPPPEEPGLRPLWLKNGEPTEPAGGYLSPRGLERFLRGVPVATDDVVGAEELFAWDYRTGIGIAADRLVAEDSQIFGRGFLVLKRDVGLYAEIDGASASSVAQIEMLPLGGEGRHVTVRCLDRPASWPRVEVDGDRKPVLLLTTPCAFRAGWKPQCLDTHLAAAAVPRAIAFSGWDLARGGPKPTRFAVPAGSVYFLESPPDHDARSLAEGDEERRQGWGVCLTGVWTDE